MNPWIAASLVSMTLAGCAFGTTFDPLAPTSPSAPPGPSSPPDYQPPAAPSSPDDSADPTVSSTGGPITEDVPGACNQEFGRDASNELAAATPIKPGTFTGCLADGDKGDNFVLTSSSNPGGTLYEVELANGTAGYHELELFDADKNKLADDQAINSLKKNSAWMHVAPGSRSFIRVTDGTRYTLTVKATEVDDPTEPNDDREHATKLKLGAPARGVMSAMANRDSQNDVFVLKVPRAGTLSIAVVDVGPAVEMAASVSNSDREKLGSDVAKNRGANLRSTVRLQAAGTYYITLSSPYAPLSKGYKDAAPTHVKAPYILTATLD